MSFPQECGKNDQTRLRPGLPSHLSECASAVPVAAARRSLSLGVRRPMASSQARSPLLAEPPLTDQALIDYFGNLKDGALTSNARSRSRTRSRTRSLAPRLTRLLTHS